MLARVYFTFILRTNAAVTRINRQLIARIPTQSRIYASLNRVVDEADEIHYPIEFLESLELNGVPPHILDLKIGAPILLLRNLDPPTLVNGTRLVIIALYEYLIEATILCGPGEGTKVFIPRIPIIPTDMPFQFKRLQFPVVPCYAMTINKSQGECPV